MFRENHRHLQSGIARYLPATTREDAAAVGSLVGRHLLPQDFLPDPGVDSPLMDYENMGILQRLKGLLVGRPMRYTEKEKQHLRDMVLERTMRYKCAIIADMDFGHTAPQFTVPRGCRARIDAENQRFEFIDAAVE